MQKRFEKATLVFVTAVLVFAQVSTALPVVVNTWAFTDATKAAWSAVTDEKSSKPALEAVTQGCRSCEQSQCDLTVGFGGSPDERSETSLDAMIMDGDTMDVGAVGGLVHCKEAVLTARRVLEHTQHSLLVGLQATEFAVEMGLPLSNLSTTQSRKMWHDWRAQNCQPNFRKNVVPDSSRTCGPYQVGTGAHPSESKSDSNAWVCESNHDTISMMAIDRNGHAAAASSSNGANHKVPGRVGDASVAGGGAYVESGVGGCASTGDGDLHLRFLPCYQVVESLRRGSYPQDAAKDAVRRILKYYPSYVGAVLAVNATGHHAAAASNWKFTYAYQDNEHKDVQLVEVEPITLSTES